MGAAIKRFRRGSIGENLFDILNLLLMIVLALIILYPLLNLMATSVSDDGPILRGEVTFYPKGFDLEGYKMIAGNQHILRSFGNSILVALVGCVCSLFFTCLASYPLVFSDFYGKKIYNMMILITMWFSGGIIPTYMVVRSLGLIDKLPVLVIVPLIGAYNVIVLSSFFRSIPFSLYESAIIDGANDFTILFRIVIPLSKAALATISLWVIVMHWNDFMSPLMYLTDFKKFTMQLVLRDIVLTSSTAMYELMSQTSEGGVAAISEQLKSAVLTFSMVPMLLLYPFLQKYFTKGIMIGAVKG